MSQISNKVEWCLNKAQKEEVMHRGLVKITPDITKAKRLLGWEPKTSIEEGLRETIEYFKMQK